MHKISAQKKLLDYIGQGWMKLDWIGKEKIKLTRNNTKMYPVTRYLRLITPFTT